MTIFQVYHIGERALVELHVVMDENLPLKIAHDVTEGLTRKIQCLSDVERAFVHIDYTCDGDDQTNKLFADKNILEAPKFSIISTIDCRNTALSSLFPSISPFLSTLFIETTFFRLYTTLSSPNFILSIVFSYTQ